MENDFITWLLREIESRGWTNAEFCRRSGISQAMVSLVISGERQPGDKFCQGVARAFRGEVTLEEVMRRTHRLPRMHGDDPTLKELLEIANQLSPDVRRELLEYSKYLAGRAHTEGN